MKVGVIGTGYVGLVAGAGFADFGNDVVCVDIDEQRIAGLRRGEIPIHEPGLAELVRDNMAGGRLRFTTDYTLAVADAEVVLLCVGTPPLADGSADLSQVLIAARAVGTALGSEFTVIVNKSTVPVGTAEQVREVIAGVTSRAFAVVSNPEFLKEGSAIDDFLRPMRVIVGVGPGAGPAHSGPAAAVDDRARTVMRRLYAAVVRTSDRMLVTDARTAELTKYACNAYLAMRVSFINDMASLCERVGADVELLRRGMGMDTRIGPRFLFPGIGYGGSCFPKDTRALLACAQDHDLDLPLVAATERINERQKLLLLDKLCAHLGHAQRPQGLNREKILAGKTIAIWGLSFKPETDDVREAPALRLIEELVALGAVVRASDPVANPRAADELQRTLGSYASAVTYFDDAYAAARGADVLCLCTEWRQFRQPNFRRLVAELRDKAVFDGRNIWDPEQVRELGLTYYGIGRA